MIIIAKCDQHNCNFNEYGWCNTLPELEDRYCVMAQIDESRCANCGCDLELIREPFEYMGHEVFENILICTNCLE